MINKNGQYPKIVLKTDKKSSGCIVGNKYCIQNLLVNHFQESGKFILAMVCGNPGQVAMDMPGSLSNTLGLYWNLAQMASSLMILQGVIPSLFHQDPIQL